MNSDDLQLAWQLLPLQLGNTLYMVGISGFLAAFFGLPLGILLTLSNPGHLLARAWLYRLLSTLVNITRSFPFAILMVALIPFTRALIGSSLGTTASIVPLTIAAIPLVARLVETSLLAVDRDLIEAARVMGSNLRQIISKVLLPEALPQLILDMTMTLVSLISYSAMAGLVGGGGLGQLAIQYGYQRFNGCIMVSTVILLILLVQLLQGVGSNLSSALLKQRGKSL